jgi:hypothetical protein
METPNPASVRRAVAAAMARLGATPADLGALEETLLYSRGKFQGRSYRAGGYLATWIAGTSFVQLYDETGSAFSTLELCAPGEMRRAA